MSIELMTGVWKHGPRNMGERLVLLSLADQANDDGYCWPSFRSLAQRCAMTRRGVRGIVDRLEDDGWLRRERRHRDDGTYTSNGYWLNYEKLVGNDVPQVGNDVPQGRERGSPGVGNDVPTMNPQVETSVETAAAAFFLREFGLSLNATTGQLVGLQPEYIRAHLDYARRRNEPTGLAIRRMIDGDPAPGLRKAIPDEYADVVRR